MDIMKKFYRQILVLIVVFLLAIVLISKNKTEDNSNEKQAMEKSTRSMVVSVADVKEEDLDIYETTIGSIENFNSVIISSEASGVIEKINFEIGDQINIGKVLVEIDDSSLQNDRKSQLAEISRLSSTLDNNLKTLTRYKSLIKQGVISQETFDTAQVAVDVARDQLNFAKAKLSNIEISIKRTQLQSSKKGIVQSRFVNQGDLLSMGQKVLELVDNSKVIIIVSLPEKFSGVLKANAEVKLYGYVLQEPIITNIKEIKPLINQNTRSLDIIIEIDNSKYQLKPGGTVKADILISNLEKALIIPSQAVVLRPVGQVVYVLGEGNKVKEVPVSIGYTKDGMSQIISDSLKAGDKVVLEGAGFLTDGITVSVN